MDPHTCSTSGKEWTEQRELLVLNVDSAQREVIRQLFNHFDWDFDGAVQQVETIMTNHHHQNTNQDMPHVIDDADVPGFIDPPDVNAAECPYCYCRPCVTDNVNRQMWWGDAAVAPSRWNSRKRKCLYKKFWTMLTHKQAWTDQRYLAKKVAALGRDPNKRYYGWIHKRDIMPDCVLKMVRGWLPNMPGTAYMDHMWE